MLDAQLLTMILGKGNLFRIVIAAIIERNGQCDTFLIVVKQGGGVHTSTENQYAIFHLIVFLPAKVIFFLDRRTKEQKNNAVLMFLLSKIFVSLQHETETITTDSNFFATFFGHDGAGLAVCGPSYW